MLCFNNSMACGAININIDRYLAFVYEHLRQSQTPAYKIVERWRESNKGAVSAAYKMDIIKEVTLLYD